jgi:hypothetical protein
MNDIDTSSIPRIPLNIACIAAAKSLSYEHCKLYKARNLENRNILQNFSQQRNDASEIRVSHNES